MENILLFIKDFELGSKVSTAIVDYKKNVEFCDENTSPDDFVDRSLLAVVDLDEPVFFSVGLMERYALFKKSPGSVGFHESQ